MLFEVNIGAPNTELLRFLRQKKMLEQGETVLHTEKPGEGNMNVVLRVVTDRRSLIIKQARPFVQKYPQIPAPLERVLVERKFYQLAGEHADLKQFLPNVLGFSAQNHLLALEDLGASADYTHIYQKGKNITQQETKDAVGFLLALHTAFKGDPRRKTFPKNLALRGLNHEHIFHYPFLEQNGFDLDQVQPGLQALSTRYKCNADLLVRVTNLGKRYLASGDCLLHGDYYPGSWLATKAGFRVIDPEFCFFGPAEYDFGILIAHLMMAQTPVDLIEMAKASYHSAVDFDHQLVAQFTGVELMRRIIGLAQLPLDLSLDERGALLETAEGLLK